jgi:hypothetical protein
MHISGGNNEKYALFVYNHCKKNYLGTLGYCGLPIYTHHMPVEQRLIF